MTTNPLRREDGLGNLKDVCTQNCVRGFGKLYLGVLLFCHVQYVHVYSNPFNCQVQIRLLTTLTISLLAFFSWNFNELFNSPFYLRVYRHRRAVRGCQGTRFIAEGTDFKEDNFVTLGSKRAIPFHIGQSIIM